MKETKKEEIFIIMSTDPLSNPIATAIRKRKAEAMQALELVGIRSHKLPLPRGVVHTYMCVCVRCKAQMEAQRIAEMREEKV